MRLPHVATTGQVVCGGLNLSCGDWIRIGNAELVIRYCGGGCKSKRRAGDRARTANSWFLIFGDAGRSGRTMENQLGNWEISGLLQLIVWFL